MNDDTDKLAAQMQNLKPSKTSRKAGLEAAMAAFNTEFAAETGPAAEKNSTSSQGSADESRPTGKPTTSVRVKTRRVETMRKFTAIFQKPQAMMMAGTCGAALIAALVVLPNMDELAGDLLAPEGSADIGAKTAMETDITLPEVLVPEISDPEISKAETPNSPQAEDVKTPQQDSRADEEPSPQIQNKTKSSASEFDPKSETSENIITIERQILKTPGRTEERIIPAEYDTIERRVIVRPERAEWASTGVNPETGQTGYARQIVPAEYETKPEKVVLRHEHVQYINIPPIYEVVKETVRINDDGSTEVLSTDVIGTKQDEVKLPPAPPALKTPQPIAVVSKPKIRPIQPSQNANPSTTGKVNTSTKGQFAVFNGVSNQVVESTETIVSQTGEILCRVLIPAKYKTITKQVVKTPARTVERSIPAITKDVTVQVRAEDGGTKDVTKTFVVREAIVETVTTPPVYETRSERVLIEPAREEWKPGSQAINAGAIQAPSSPIQAAPVPQNGIASVDQLLSAVRQNKSKPESENRSRIQLFESRMNQQSGFIAAAPPPPVPSPVEVQTAPLDGVSQPAPKTEKFAGLKIEYASPEFETVTETVVIQPASVEYVSTPIVYQTVQETVVVQEASTELVTIPAVYEWVEGDIEGSSTELEFIPPEYETVTETIVVQEASTEYVSIPKSYETVKETIIVQPEYLSKDGKVVPAVTEEVARRVIKTPASTTERVIPAKTSTVTRQVLKTPGRTVEKTVPYERRDGKTRVVVKAASVVERTVPVVTKQETRRVIKSPASTVERHIPAVTKQVQKKALIPQKVYLRDSDGNIVREFENRDAFEAYKANLPTAVSEKPVSTFSVDVDTASYSFLRASINRGQLPPRESIRLEEMINYFPYDYEAPKTADKPFKANVTVTSNPWNVDTKLMHVGIKGYVPTETEKPHNNLVFLIDTSGSMKDAKKLPLLINSFKLLLNTLDEDDTVSIVTYAATVQTALEPTPVRDKSDILEILKSLQAAGGTAGAAGLQMAYENAEKTFDADGNNRVILATDGDFNVGFSSPDEMKDYIEEKRETGIFLSVLGFGMGNYNDHLMQSLAQNGNGVAAYIDSLSEANKVLANEAGSSLLTIAKDVKIQVEFNPATISEYRLLGYETRALKRQDFNNDKVDAGDIGAGHSVTAIYEMTPVGSPAITVDKLRYVSDDAPKNTGSDEYAFVKIRHKLPDADTSTLQTFPIGKRQERSLRRASDDMRFATAVSIVGQKLRGDMQVDDYSYADAIKLANSAKGKDENGYRAEFVQMVKLIEAMSE